MLETDLTLLGGLLAVEEDLARAEPLLRELRESPRSWRELSEMHRNLLLGVPMVEFLRQSSREARYEDPQKMVELAEAARLLADNLSEDRYGRRVIADYRARAWADVGNAYRVAGDLGAAMSAFRRAAGLLDQGTHRFVREVASLLASLLSDLGHFDHAAEILEQCLELKGCDPEETVKLLTQLGLVLGYANDPERAVVVLLRALGCLSADSPHWLAVVQALALNLVDAGHFPAARVLLKRHETLYKKSGKLNKLRRIWLEGKIGFGLREFRKAEGHFNVARLAFRREDQEFDFALVSLDLALLYLKQGRRSELVWLVDDMVRRFNALGIAQEAIASLLLLRKGCSGGRRSVEALAAQIETIATIFKHLNRTQRR